MNQFARTCKCVSVSIFSLARPFSNFAFIEKFFVQSHPLQRIFSQIRANKGQTLVMETLGPSDELKEEDEDLFTVCQNNFIGAQAFRLSFFKSSFALETDIEKQETNAFLGYAIVKIERFLGLSRSRVYESVICGSGHRHNYVRGLQDWSSSVADSVFTTKGWLYAQQSHHTNVCAHVALKTALGRYAPEITYRKMNQLAGIGLTDVSQGMSIVQMLKVLDGCGVNYIVGDYQSLSGKAIGIPFQKFIYNCIESGFPSIVGFGTTAGQALHAIPVFGHTFNEDTWVPRAESSYFKVGPNTRYLPSESWVSMYIAHDDNWGSTFCVPREYLSEQLAYVIGTYPKEFQMNPIVAEVVGADYLFTIIRQLAPGTWSDRLQLFHKKQLSVLRLIQITKEGYAQHLEKVSDWEGNKIDPYVAAAIRGIAHDKLWMIELSIPELFSANKRKLAEVILRTDVPFTNKRDFKSFILARVPSMLAIYDPDSSPDAPKFQFLPSGCHSHVEIYNCEDEKDI